MNSASVDVVPELRTYQVALVAETLEDLKMFEYALRREMEGTDPEKLRLSGSAEVPEGWRPLVEEYYRSLAEGGR